MEPESRGPGYPGSHAGLGLLTGDHSFEEEFPLSSVPRNVAGAGWGHGSWASLSLKSSPVGSNMQPGLRTRE